MSDLELLAHADTDSDVGILYLGRRRVEGRADWVYEIQINGHLLMSSMHNISERQLSTSALALHEGTEPLRVLVGGLGLGYTAQAALENPRVASVKVIEKMDFVIRWMREGMLPLSRQLAADGRVEIVQDDVYELLLGPANERYDLVLIDVDHAPDDRLDSGIGRFYTVDGQRRVARHLSPGGILAVWSATNNDRFADVLTKVYPRSNREAVEWENFEKIGDMIQNVLFFAGGVPVA